MHLKLNKVFKNVLGFAVIDLVTKLKENQFYLFAVQQIQPYGHILACNTLKQYHTKLSSRNSLIVNSCGNRMQSLYETATIV